MNFHNWPPSRFNPARKGFDGDLKYHFDLPATAKWPLSGLNVRRVAGIWCWVEPIGYHKFQRARTICPACGRNVPAGRLAQHFKSHVDLCPHGVPPTEFCMECKA